MAKFNPTITAHFVSYFIRVANWLEIEHFSHTTDTCVNYMYDTMVKLRYCTHLLLLLMVTCLAYTTNCVEYDAVPDDHNLATKNNTLQHYLANSEEYFTSNIILD